MRRTFGGTRLIGMALIAVAAVLLFVALTRLRPAQRRPIAEPLREPIQTENKEARPKAPPPPLAPERAEGPDLGYIEYVDPEFGPGGAPVFTNPDGSPKIVARVDGYEIPLIEFEMFAAPSLKFRPGDKNRARAELLDSMIDQVALVKLAQESGIEVSGAELDEALKPFRDAAGSEEAVLAQFKEARGMTPERVYQRTRENAALKKYVETLIESIPITPEDIQAEYERMKNEGNLDAPESATFKYILAAPKTDDEAGWAEAHARIDTACARIQAGEDFLTVAKDTSDDPVLQFMGGQFARAPKEMMPAGTADYIQSAPVGTLSEPFKTAEGWHLVLVEKKHPAGEIPLEELEEGIVKQLRAKPLQELLGERVAGARKDMKIQTFLPRVPEGQASLVTLPAAEEKADPEQEPEAAAAQ